MFHAAPLADPPSLREVKAYLSAAAVDFSDCFERAELIERFRTVQLERSVTDVEQMKAKANAAFKRESYEYAVRLYTEASLAALALFGVDPGRGRSLLVQLLSNRARAYLELCMPLAAMEDAQQCLQLDPSFVKAYHRLAAAHTALGRYDEAAAVLQQALEVIPLPREDAPAEAGMRVDLTEKLRQVEAQIKAQIEAQGKQAGPRQEAGPEEEAGPRPTTPTCTTPTCGAAESVAAAAEAEVSTAAGPSDQASSEQAPVARLLLELSDDLLLEILCQLGVADLLGAASSCRVLRRACAARGCDGAWHRLCAAAWPRLSVELHTASTELAKRGATATTIATIATIGATANAATPSRRTAPLPLPLDWHVLLRERRRLSDRWERGRYTLSTLGGHKGPVYGVRLRGDLLASSSEDGSIKLWNLSLGTVTHTLEGHSHGILGLWLDPVPGQQRAVSGGFDADLRQWDFSEGTKGRCVRTMVGHSGPIVSVEATDDAIVSTSFDGTVRVWSWEGKQRASLLAHEGHSSGLALCGGVAYSGGDDGLCKRWDLETQTCVDVMQGHEGAVWSVTCDDLVHTLISASTGGSLILWDPRVPAKLVHHAPRAHNDAIAGLQFDEHKVVSSGFDSLVKIWDLRTLKERAILQTPVMTRCTRLCFDDTRIITGSLNGTVVILDVQ